jgi:23S rRNA (adenine2503-C2)-methyltransferase
VTEPLHIKDHSIERLRERLAEAGERPYRADQIAAWQYRRGIEDPEQMTDLGAELRARLAGEWQLAALEVERVDRSVDGRRAGRLT